MAEVANPASPVPLDTIPISPEGDENKAPNGETTKNADDNEEVTVFHDPENFNVKHPLMHQWTLWFTKPPSGKVCLAERMLPRGRRN
jgi:translation initiation factor 4E